MLRFQLVTAAITLAWAAPAWSQEKQAAETAIRTDSASQGSAELTRAPLAAGSQAQDPPVIVVPGREPERAPPPQPTPEAPAPAQPREAPPRLLPHELERPESESQGQGDAVKLPERRTFALELGLGVNTRLASGSAFDEDETQGVIYGAGLWMNAFERVAVGLAVEHVGLGRASDQSAANFVSVEYASTAGWLGGRFVALRTRELEAFVALRVGLAFQHLSADGVRQAGSAFEAATPFSCNETDGPSAALGGGIGASWGLGSRLRLLGRVDATGERLAGGVLGQCAPGTGSVTNLAFGIGLAYGFGELESGARGALPAGRASAWRGRTEKE